MLFKIKIIIFLLNHRIGYHIYPLDQWNSPRNLTNIVFKEMNQNEYDNLDKVHKFLYLLKSINFFWIYYRF